MAGSKRSPWQNLLIAIAATVSLVGGYYLGNLASSKKLELKTATVLPEPRTISEFNLIDFNGEAFTLDHLKGKWNMIFFGYTSCPDICPIALNSMVEVNKAFSSKLKEQVQTIFISVDPQRDTPAHLKEYVNFFNPDFLAATGEDTELRALTKQLALSYTIRPPDDKGDYLVDHSSYLIIVNPDAGFHAVISGSHYSNPKAIAEDIAIITDID